jgi:hypothetical protein
LQARRSGWKRAKLKTQAGYGRRGCLDVAARLRGFELRTAARSREPGGSALGDDWRWGTGGGARLGRLSRELFAPSVETNRLDPNHATRCDAPSGTGAPAVRGSCEAMRIAPPAPAACQLALTAGRIT